MAYLENVRTFVRIYELGNMSAAARDLRISAAVASARMSQLEDHLGVRLFQRTTRQLNPTEQGTLFYDGACKIIQAVDAAEAEISTSTGSPRGTLHVAAPLGLGERFIAPAVPAFRALYPLVNLRLRLSDRHLDIAAEGLDAAFFLGSPKDSQLRMRKIADCPRLLCAAPSYIEGRGMPNNVDELTSSAHDCLNLRYPGAPDFQWPILTDDGVKRIPVTGPLESDHGDVLTKWALAGHGIILKPQFDVAADLAAGRLIQVLAQTPPTPVTMACLYTHRKGQDPKARLFIDFMVAHIQSTLLRRPDSARDSILDSALDIASDGKTP
jgi:LysR family transcriptional activator of dmlA